MWVRRSSGRLGGCNQSRWGRSAARCILGVVGRRNTRNEASEESGAAAWFGARLRSLREAAGLTQEELAFRAGLSPNAVGTLERGTRKHPYPHTVRSLADALGLSQDERATLLAAVPRREATPPDIPDPESPGSNLPSPPTPLVGRERELAEISDLLGSSEVRLLTLTGIGGVGKTRLALALARAALVEDRFPDGVAYVALAPLRDPALVVSTIARSLDLREEQGQSAADALRAHLREKRTLLVLDNLEHLLEAADEVVHLIGACADLVVLATSRAPLRVRGEQEYPVPPLMLPSSTHNPTKEEVHSTPSGRLFAERARAASPSFALTTENAPSVAAMCWRLAGLPLALELAAAKVRLLEPAALLPRLDQALSTAWARDLPERQRSMRATLDWSYELLKESERRLFGRLSIFVGGFSLEGAEAVGASEEPEEVLGLLGALVEQSLVVVQPPKAGGEVRYGMLEPVRQYALEKLEESGEAKGTRQRHVAFFLGLAERAEPELRGPDQSEWLERLEQENDDLRAAMSWALSTEDHDTAVRLGWALAYFWWPHGYHREGRRWMEAILERTLPPTLRTRALEVAAAMAYMQGDYSVAEERYRGALRLSRRVGDELVEGSALAGTGLVEMARQDYEAAASSMEEAIELFERCGEDYLAAFSRVMLGTTLLARGEAERAERAFEEGLVSARRLKIPSLGYITLYNSAQSALARGDLEKAARMLGEGIELSWQTKDRANLAYFLEALAAVRALGGEAECCALLLGAAEALLEEVGARVYNFYNPDSALRERAVDEVRAVLGDAAFEEARARGREMDFKQAVAYALGADAPPGNSVS